MGKEVAKAYRKTTITRVRTVTRKNRACIQYYTKEMQDKITTEGLVLHAAEINQVPFRVGDMASFHREDVK